MTRKQEAVSHVNNMPKSWLVKKATRSTPKIAGETINARRFVTENPNHTIFTCTPHSPNICGVLGQPNGIVVENECEVIYNGPALAIAQSALKPELPLKVGEDGRVVNGIIRHTGSRTILAATNGTDSHITQPDANNETLTAVSNIATDNYTHVVWVYASQKTTGYPMVMKAVMNGTTAVTMTCAVCPDSPTTVGTAALCDEVYGLYKTDSAGTVSIYDSTIVGALTVGAAAAGSTVNLYRTYNVGQVTQTAGTLNLYTVRTPLVVAGTFSGDYDYYNANYIQHFEGGLSSNILVGLFSIDGTTSYPRISGGQGFSIITFKNMAAGQQLTEGNLAGGAGTAGFITFAGANGDIFIGFDLPENFVDTGVAADFKLEAYIDQNGAGDTFDWAVYEVDPATGTYAELTAQVGDSTGSAVAAWHIFDADANVGMGDAALTKGRPLVLYLGNFSASANVWMIRLTYKVGIQNAI